MFAALGKVLFLHGWSSNGGRKSSYMRCLGYDMLTPRLSNWSFRRAFRSAQAAYDDFHPDVIVGSSRGGALAMCLKNRVTPLVLLAPAWRICGVEPRLPVANGVVIHSRWDRLVPLSDSIELCRLNPSFRLIVAGASHRLNDGEARQVLKNILDGLARFQQPTARYSPADQFRTNSF